MKRYLVAFFLTVLVVGGIMAKPVSADTTSAWFNLSATDLQKDYVVSYPGFDFKVTIPSRTNNEALTVELRKEDPASFKIPSDMKLVSDIWRYDIKRTDTANTQALKFPKKINFNIRYQDATTYGKKIYLWDGSKKRWLPVDSSENIKEHFVNGYFHLNFAQFAVFEDKSELLGIASWYRDSRHPSGAATNNYPMGTKLRVTNLNNNKTVDVQVVSTGPFGKGRVIDLVLPSFSKIEQSWKGLAQVHVSLASNNVKVLGANTMSSDVNAPKLTSKAAMAINEKTGEVLFEKNSNAAYPIASLSKIMTAAIFLKTQTPMDKVVTYKALDNAIGAKLYVTPGETMTTKDLFYTMLVGSANNAANALARSTGLSMAEFVQRMNDQAKEWGLTSTHFDDVSGLDEDNSSSVSDYARLSAKALKEPLIMKASMTPHYTFTTLNTKQAHTIVNKNKMFGAGWYVTGMKTGYLDEAGYCLMVRTRVSKSAPPDVITVILGSSTDTLRYSEMKALIKYALTKV